MERFALLSVTDKTGLVKFASQLSAAGLTLLSTGGTAKLLRQQGLFVSYVSEHTGLAEMFDGRLKTLHPKIFGPILARRTKRDDMSKLEELQWGRIDVVAVNLYDFEGAVRKGLSFGETMEQIDIGGPSLLRAAAKNFEGYGPLAVCDPADYERVAKWILEGNIPVQGQLELVQKVFQMTQKYDADIAAYVARQRAKF